MRKIVFMLKVNPNPRSTTPKNLEISTHKGARLTIIGNQATVLDVTNDEMSDSELQNWYRSRYSGLGMGISILHDPEVKVTTSVKEIEKVHEQKTTKRKSKKEKPADVPVKQETVIPEEKASVEEMTSVVSKVEPKESEIMPLPEVSENTNTIDDAGAVADLQSFLWS